MRENAWLAASLYPAALLWFGWAADRGVFWLVPALANFFFGLGSMIVFGAATTMLTEFMPRRSSGGIAINNFVRNICSCVGAVVTQPLINAMGVGWLCTAVAPRGHRQRLRLHLVAADLGPALAEGDGSEAGRRQLS